MQLRSWALLESSQIGIGEKPSTIITIFEQKTSISSEKGVRIKSISLQF